MEYMNDKELAEVFVNHLPIGVEETERLIEGIKKGYMLGKVDYVIALESRDRALNELIRENRWLRNKLGYPLK